MQNLTCSLPSFSVNKVYDANTLATQAKNDGVQINWAKNLLDIPAIWRTTQGEGVKVAVLDTGVDCKHPDLKPAIAATCDFTGQGVQDGNGHGTHCAGIIGARNTQGNFCGVAPKSELYIGKVLTNEGGGTLENVVKGIEWAISEKVDIISMSLGGRGSSPKLYSIIHEALAHGICVFCAAGNEGSIYQNSIGYPGRYGGVITIAACDQNGNPSGFSSRGGEVDFMAPGANIWSTYPGGRYAQLSGTSMATPFAVGIASLVEAKHHQDPAARTPLNNNADMKEHLMVLSTHPGWHTNDSGYGVLRPFASLAR